MSAYHLLHLKVRVKYRTAPKGYCHIIPYHLPEHRKIFARMSERGIVGRLHVCGNTKAILPLTSKCGAKIVDVDHVVDFGEALEIAGGSCILNGNIDPVADVYACDAAHTEAAILAAAQKAAGRRAMFMPGCELPGDTKLDNILAIHSALVQIGP